jgi:hypothetical protein
VNRSRHIVVTVIVNDCRSVTVGANVVGSVFVQRRRRLNFLGFPNNDGLVNVDHGGKYWRSRKNAWCWWREWRNFIK